MLIEKLIKGVIKENEAILIVSPDNRRYFTGFPSSDGYFVVTKNDAVFFTDSRYIEAAEVKTKNCRCLLLTRPSEEIKEFLNENKISKILTERERLTIDELDNLKKAFSPIKVNPSKILENKINKLRSVKTNEEVEKIIAAQRIAEKAFEHICKFIKPGVTEKQIQLELDFYMLSHGAEALSFETIAITGKKTSMPHGVPGDDVVKVGDFVTMDYGAVYDGYHSDMTRTVAVGKVSEEQKKIYNIVLKAQNAALNAYKEGLPCKEGDAAARRIIEEEGYGAYFGHGTGHGVGVEIHENPFVSPRSEAILKAGNVITAEPGIYIPGKFGVRIEDMALVTKKGAEDLTLSPKELIIL